MSDTAAGNLQPRAFLPLPLGSILPRGWLHRQLWIQADGLTGHLDEFWPDIRDSGWIGGKAEGWERAPYWLDGLIPLSFLLQYDLLTGKMHRWMDYILTHQNEDGWLGPVKMKRTEPGSSLYDPWPMFVILKVLTQYQETTQDPRVIPAMHRLLRRIDSLLDEHPLESWAKYRWMDLVFSVQWLHERQPEVWLLKLAQKARKQGFDWKAHLANFQYPERVPADKAILDTHVVNNAMGIKQPAVTFWMTGNAGDRQAIHDMIATLDTYHGQVTGLFSGDEHYAGRSPSQGTELCAVNEYAFSLEQAISILGDAALADRLESIVFNGLPAACTADMWAHQYDQLANQAVCRVSKDRTYATNGADANIFGLEPNYGCCTANMHQGWPKFTASLWMQSPDNGLAAISYAPCSVSAQCGGAPVKIEVESNYPFEGEVRILITADAVFPLRLRIPAWAEGAAVTLAGEAPIEAKPGTFLLLNRTWSGVTEIKLSLPMNIRTQRRYQNSISLFRGPLVLSLKVGEYWKQIGGELPHADYEVYPTAPWNYALDIDEANPAASVTVETQAPGEFPFSPEGAPVRATVKGRLLPEWIIEHSAAAPPPESPVSSTQPEVDLILIPYGSAKLRISEFPKLAP